MTISATMDSLGNVDVLRDKFAQHDGIAVLGDSCQSGFALVHIEASTLPELIDLAAIVCGCSLPAGDDLLVESGDLSYWVQW